MIDVEELKRLATDALQQLNVGDTVRATGVCELSFGAYLVSFGDVSPDTRFPVFEIGVQQDWSGNQAGRELRLELRRKLWICPLCQRRGKIRRIVDREVLRVECNHCGRFEIESQLLDHLRRSQEDHEEFEAQRHRLARLSDYVRQATAVPLLSAGNWLEIGGATRG